MGNTHGSGQGMTAMVDRHLKRIAELKAENERLTALVPLLESNNKDLAAEINLRRKQCDEFVGYLREENERLQKCCTQRGARMQIMRDWIAYSSQPLDGWDRFVSANPSAAKWFDVDGVTVGGEGE